MPEIAELSLMRDFINRHANKRVIRTQKSSITKVKTDDVSSSVSFYAKSKGKELMLCFDDCNIVFTMGMSGNWHFGQEVPKHGHFTVVFEDGLLSMVDPRRFAKWKRQKDFSDNRGPEIIDPSFLDFLRSKRGCKSFNKPCYEVMMDQRYFNGIGNYFRAELLYRMGVNPFQTLNQLLNSSDVLLVEKCKEIYEQAYSVGGGEFLTFKNPNAETKGKNWMLCYNNKEMSKTIDSKGRTLWHDPKHKK